MVDIVGEVLEVAMMDGENKKESRFLALGAMLSS
jgi:hypothetical protein